MMVVDSCEFEKKRLAKILQRGRIDLTPALKVVDRIIADVKEKGDRALLGYTKKFDKANLTASRLRVAEEEIKDSYKRLGKTSLNSLKTAAKNIAKFHRAQPVDAWSLEVAEGATAGQVTRPLSSVGVYVPRGEAPYPSTVLMCVIPAKIAGVNRIVVCSPPRSGGDVDPAVLVAADIAGASEVYRAGGAQAIAAMAYGTRTVPKVEKIVGPGNIFVTTAKIQVSRDVAIEFPAGPSEIVIIADEEADPNLIASDLLAQAEHDPRSLPILLTTSRNLAYKVETLLHSQVKTLPRKKTAKSSLKNWGSIVLVDDMEEAVYYANSIAPEHLEILARNTSRLLGRIRNSGAVFLGPYSPVALGDYSAGTNHVLPTGGYAKFYSGLSTRDFVKTISVLKCSRKGFRRLRESAASLAELEGFKGHARSIYARGD